MSRFDKLRKFVLSASNKRRHWVTYGAPIATVTAAITLNTFSIASAEENRLPCARKKVVILGSGWAAASMLREISDDFDVSVVSPRNYFLFTPLLPGVSVGTNEDRSIIEPIRSICLKNGKQNVQFYEAKCTNVDLEKNMLFCEDRSPLKGQVSSFWLPYDYLVVAVGAKNNTFGTPGVRQFANFLKSVEDAQKIRSKIVDAFESANLPGQPEEERQRLLRFVVVGGGPTGVEYAAELHDFLVDDAKRFFPHLVKDVSVVLLQSGDHILNTFDLKISQYAESRFNRDSIQVLTNHRVKEVTEKAVIVTDNKTKKTMQIPYAVCVWSTGITQTSLVQKMVKQIPVQSHARALVTDGYLRVKGLTNVFAIGDCATIELPLLRSRLTDLYWKYDVDSDGTISRDEFRQMFDEIVDQYPQLQVYGRKAEGLFEEYDVNSDGQLSLGEFEELLKKADNNITTLPATAQVASQEGKYLAGELSAIVNEKPLLPFTYHHLGSLAKIGTGDAVAEIGPLASGGLWAWWLWGAAYLSRQYSMRNRFNILLDWLRKTVFGRDVSRF